MICSLTPPCWSWSPTCRICVPPAETVVNEALLAGVRTVVSDRAGAACLVIPENGAVVSVNARDAFREALEAQLAATEPFDGTLRPDLMPYGFESMISRLMDDLK